MDARGEGAMHAIVKDRQFDMEARGKGAMHIIVRDRHLTWRQEEREPCKS